MEEEDNDGRLKLKSSLLVWLSAKVMIENETFRTHCIQPSSLVCEKHVRKRKGAVKMRMTVLKTRIRCTFTRLARTTCSYDNDDDFDTKTILGSHPNAY